MQPLCQSFALSQWFCYFFFPSDVFFLPSVIQRELQFWKFVRFSKKSKPNEPHRHFSVHSLRPTSCELPDHKSVYCQFPEVRHWLEYIRITWSLKKTRWAELARVNMSCLVGLWGLTVWLEFSTFWTQVVLLSELFSLAQAPLSQRSLFICHYSMRLSWNEYIKTGKRMISLTQMNILTDRARDDSVDARVRESHHHPHLACGYFHGFFFPYMLQHVAVVCSQGWQGWFARLHQEWLLPEKQPGRWTWQERRDSVSSFNATLHDVGFLLHGGLRSFMNLHWTVRCVMMIHV